MQTVEGECLQNFKSKVGVKYFNMKTCVLMSGQKRKLILKK